VSGMTQRLPGQAPVTHNSDPAILIQRPVGEHFKILNATSPGGFGMIKAVYHADAFDGLLFNTVDLNRLRQLRGFKYRRGDIDHMVKLGSNTPRILNTVGPGNNQWIARAT